MNAPRPAGLRLLSRRRLAALRLAAEGNSRAQIAVKLGITVHTAAVYLSEATTALGARDLNHAVELGREQGLFAPGGAAVAVITVRQREALRLAANGATNAVIARCLHVAPATAHTLMQHAYRTLGVGSRTQAVAVAILLGIVPLEAIALPAALTDDEPAELRDAA